MQGVVASRRGAAFALPGGITVPLTSRLLPEDARLPRVGMPLEWHRLLDPLDRRRRARMREELSRAPGPT